MQPQEPKARILIFDLETRGLVADYGSIFCVGWKFIGDKAVQVKSIHDFPGRHPLDDKPLIEWFFKNVWAKADIAAGWYSSGHDEPFLRTRAIIHKLSAPKPVTTCDLWGKVWKRFKFSKNSLHNVASQLGLTQKWYNKPQDFEKVLYGDKAAMRRIVKHCKIDVEITEQAYERFKSFVLVHPRVTLNNFACRTCGGTNLQKRGWRFSALKGKMQLVWCKDCRSWDQKNSKELR